MLKKHLSAALLGLVLSMSGTAAIQAAEISRGVMLSTSCAACHGPNGQSPGSIPSLHGKSKAFIVNSLKKFRSGEREGTVMNRHAKAYSDEEIELIAEYFAGLK